MGGTGLGLVICKALCSSMGGFVKCKSSPRVGSTFTFSALVAVKKMDCSGGDVDSNGFANSPDIHGMGPVSLNSDTVAMDNFAMGASNATDSSDDSCASLHISPSSSEISACEDRACCIDQQWDLATQGRRSSVTNNPFEPRQEPPGGLRRRLRRHKRLESAPVSVVRHSSFGPTDLFLYPELDEGLWASRRLGSGSLRGATVTPDELHEGSTASFTSGERDSAEEKGGSDGPLSAVGARPRILVVDDVRMNRVLVCRMLEALDAEVIEAEDGEVAVATCRDTKFSVIIMDAIMPVMDGSEAARLIRSGDGASHNTPIIALTACPVFRLSRGGDNFNDLLIKPITRGTLLAKLVKWTSEAETLWINDAWTRYAGGQRGAGDVASTIEADPD